MQIGMVGLGRMGANLSLRLIKHGHSVVAYDVNDQAVESLAAKGAIGATSIEDLIKRLPSPRVVWIMVPAGQITQEAVDSVSAFMEAGDTIIDGGNSYYRDDIARAKQLGTKGIHYVDVGTSGGIWGLERGYCLMIGGENDVVEKLEPIFEAIAPGFDAAPRTVTRSGELSNAERGFLHCGENGAGHFVKMVHNGIEYGAMAAYAEGLNILRNANIGTLSRAKDSETAPLENPEFYQYEINVAEVTEVWRRGSVISSWLLDLTSAALAESPTLEDFSGVVSDSGEGRWTAIAAVEEGVPAPVLTSALYSRFASRNLDSFSNQVLSAMRKGFGGHYEKPPSP